MRCILCVWCLNNTLFLQSVKYTVIPYKFGQMLFSTMFVYSKGSGVSASPSLWHHWSSRPFIHARVLKNQEQMVQREHRWDIFSVWDSIFHCRHKKYKAQMTQVGIIGLDKPNNMLQYTDVQTYTNKSTHTYTLSCVSYTHTQTHTDPLTKKIR